jgi:isopentenyl-diphosphate delta-isomerase
MAEERVILVDVNDHETGTSEKLRAHQTGQLHRALSVFIFNSKKEMLLQRRADSKYHSGGLWTNACCSHPRPGENTADAAKRRLAEEMGMNCNDLKFLFTFIYEAKLNNELTEHELDHVFLGVTDATPEPDPAEVSDFIYVDINHIKKDLMEHPDNYTFWFKVIFDRVVETARHHWITRCD